LSSIEVYGRNGVGRRENETAPQAGKPLPLINPLILTTMKHSKGISFPKAIWLLMYGEPVEGV